MSLGHSLHRSPGWDQFAADERLFGIESNDDERPHIATIDRNHLKYAERGARAERLARFKQAGIIRSLRLPEGYNGQALAGRGEDQVNDRDGIRPDISQLSHEPNEYTPTGSSGDRLPFGTVSSEPDHDTDQNHEGQGSFHSELRIVPKGQNARRHQALQKDSVKPSANSYSTSLGNTIEEFVHPRPTPRYSVHSGRDGRTYFSVDQAHQVVNGQTSIWDRLTSQETGSRLKKDETKKPSFTRPEAASSRDGRLASHPVAVNVKLHKDGQKPGESREPVKLKEFTEREAAAEREGGRKAKESTTLKRHTAEENPTLREAGNSEKDAVTLRRLTKEEAAPEQEVRREKRGQGNNICADAAVSEQVSRPPLFEEGILSDTMPKALPEPTFWIPEALPKKSPQTYGWRNDHIVRGPLDEELFEVNTTLGRGSLGIVEEFRRKGTQLPTLVRKRFIVPMRRRQAILQIIEEEAKNLKSL
ncbi:hypothetical protein EK21DRAFT_113802 [Setomelanomma holmii]|uniref:Uncharacterized protein n=1 Tax=Setomelanomma holmii TaxID=210430 RepID=A0A9P4H768_9PLEO|nr:hypothetical protein EK21DRAFT_113802 [Setomelanomma holmii]